MSVKTPVVDIQLQKGESVDAVGCNRAYLRSPVMSNIERCIQHKIVPDRV